MIYNNPDGTPMTPNEVVDHLISEVGLEKAAQLLGGVLLGVMDSLEHALSIRNRDEVYHVAGQLVICHYAMAEMSKRLAKAGLLDGVKVAFGGKGKLQ